MQFFDPFFKNARIRPMKQGNNADDRLEPPQKAGYGPILYLARHGQTDYNLNRIFQGSSDIPLNDTGRRQAIVLRDTLIDVPLTRAYISPLERARETAATILKDRIVPEKVELRLKELDFGDWEGTPEAEVKEKWMEDYMDYRNDMANFHPRNGEAAVDTQKRSGEWWDEISKEFPSPDEHILVVSHQSLNAVLACYVVGIALERAWENFKSKPGEVIRIVPSPIAHVSKLMPDVD